ncbi:glycosyltransferase family 2 protein [Zoogloea sp.]|uniref:glycosyltransferase family 2 protein n=1 Tax=Zoogloea sp. TaxID=49181 RepID=UPI002636A0EF|nr:glycosyltransferase family 2 protein [Zoogloea sp.]MDD3354510.1 glycosyltransferase family 2 protein [Zoogloea sp.]
MSDFVRHNSSQMNDVCAVVVTYHPDLSILGRLIGATKSQVGQIVLVDNGSKPEIVAQLKRLSIEEGLQLCLFDSNRGLGAAHNQGIQIAISQGFEYVLLLDQDSEPASDMVQHLHLAHQRLSVNTHVAAVGPCFIDPVSGHRSRFVRFGRIRFQPIACSEDDDIIRADFLISSGSLISIAALESIGHMDESLFIDHVDTEWCLRAAKKGWPVYGVCKAEMFHRLGDEGIHIPLMRSRRIAVHSPLRHYYIYRNSVRLILTRGVSWQWRVNDIYRLTGILLVFLVFAPLRLKRLKNIVHGIWHGILGVKGPIP